MEYENLPTCHLSLSSTFSLYSGAMLIFYISMIWYGMVFVCYGLLFLCYAMRYSKMTWYGMPSYGMACYAMLCYEMWVNVPSFTEEFHLFCIFKLRFTGFSLYKNTLLITLHVKRL